MLYRESTLPYLRPKSGPLYALPPSRKCHRSEIKARVLPSDEFLLGHALQAFDEEGNLKDTATVEKLEKFFASFSRASFARTNCFVISMNNK